jgi:hypothetical protein
VRVVIPIMVMVVPVTLIMPPVFVFAPPTVAVLPAPFSCFTQFMTPVFRLFAVVAMLSNRAIEFMIGMD